MLERSDPLRHSVFEIEMKPVEATGADALVSAYSFCHRTFDSDAGQHRWDRKVEDLVQLSADHLILGDPHNAAACGMAITLG